VDDLVLRWVLTEEGANKLSPSWEGPFRVTQVYHPDASTWLWRMGNHC
jgi:hypothetical protein